MSRQRLFGFRTLKWLSEDFLPRVESYEAANYAYFLSCHIVGMILEASFDLVPNENRKPEFRSKGFGMRWVSENILATHAESGYLRCNDGTEATKYLHIAKVIELAELLYNLQTVPGIQAIYRRVIEDPPGLEATILELEGLRLIWFTKLGFRIVHSGAGRQLNYECEIYLPSGVTAYCEMKCKLETQEFSATTIKNTLDIARAQLPKGGCGVVILKVPSSWFNSPDTSASLDLAVEQVLRNTTRISEVVLYDRMLFEGAEYLFYVGSIRETLNQRSPCAAALDGGIFRKTPPPSLNPEHWLLFSTLTEDILQQLLEVELNQPQRWG